MFCMAHYVLLLSILPAIGFSSDAFLINPSLATRDNGTCAVSPLDLAPGKCVGGAVQTGVSMIGSDLSSVRVYPNPWRVDQHQGIPMTFDQLPPNSTVKIFTISAHWVKTLSTSGSRATWDLTNHSGQNVASGIYLYLVSSNGQTTRGKIAVIR